jgi:hypothetical protein
VSDDVKKSPRTERITIGDGRFDIFLSSPLTQYGTPGARAYAGQATRGGLSLIAYVIEHHDLPRFELFEKAPHITSNSVLHFVDACLAIFPDSNQRQAVLIYEKPAGPPLMNSITGDAVPHQSNEVGFRHLIASLFDGIRDCYLAGVSHGRINPTNMFMRDAGAQHMQLGDYLSAAPGKYQHPAFETIERMMADPAGKGSPIASDDIYAAGVSLLLILLGKLPSLMLPTDELLRQKIEKGSLMALLGGARLPGAYSELMRGLLADDVAIRWNIDDVQHWLNGRRLGSKPPSIIRKAQRSFDLNGMHILNPRVLAQSMTQNIDAAAKQVEDGTLDRWIRRSLGDDTLAETVTEAVATASSTQRGGSLAERVVTRAAIAIDPPAPVRFRDVSIFPTGLGTLVSQYFIDSKTPRTIVDLISAQFLVYWITRQTDLGGESNIMLQTVESARMLLDRAQMGFGIERVLYELNAGMPCLSPFIAKNYILTLPAMLDAMEEVASSISPEEIKRDPIDRHIAAFCLARYKRLNDRLFPLLSGATQRQRAIAILSIYAEIQGKLHQQSKLPNLAVWLAALLDPSIERFHNRPLRDKIRKDIARIARKGDLQDLLDLVDNSTMVQKDEEGFVAAKREWQHYEQLIRETGGDNNSKAEQLTSQAQLITAFIAVFMALSAVVMMIFMQLM